VYQTVGRSAPVCAAAQQSSNSPVEVFATHGLQDRAETAVNHDVRPHALIWIKRSGPPALCAACVRSVTLTGFPYRTQHRSGIPHKEAATAEVFTLPLFSIPMELVP
jgi:hypothetical protein